MKLHTITCPHCRKWMKAVAGEHAKIGYCVRCEVRVIVMLDGRPVYLPQRDK